MTKSIRLYSVVAGAIMLSALISGCSETQFPKASGKGQIRGINSIVDAPELAFRIEERAIGNVNFRGTVGFEEWDDLTYTFNFDVFLPGEPDPIRLASQIVDVVLDTEYTLVITGTLDNPSILFWEEPERDWGGTETVFELDFVHLSPQTGQVDVYYDLEGTVPVVGNEIGTLSNGERLPYRDFTEGNYELILTAPGDPTTILFQSAAFTRSPAERFTIALFDPDPSIIANVGVNIINSTGSAQTWGDVNTPGIARIIHAAYGTENFDGYFNDDFNTTIFPNVGFGEISGFADVTDPLTAITLTPVGNTGTTIHEFEIQLVPNTRRTLALWGRPTELLSRVLIHDARPLAVFPVIRFTDFALNAEVLDIYDVEPGTVLDETVLPKFSGVIPGLSTEFFDTQEGMREFVITLNGEKDPIAPPLILDMANSTVTDIVILDTADPTAVELKIFETIP